GPLGVRSVLLARPRGRRGELGEDGGLASRPAAPAEPHAGHAQREEHHADQHQQHADHAVTFPSCAVIRPRRIVVITFAGKVIPSYGVFAATLARSAPRTVQVASGSTSTRFAGSPTSIGRPWSRSPAMSAGRSRRTFA